MKNGISKGSQCVQQTEELTSSLQSILKRDQKRWSFHLNLVRSVSMTRKFVFAASPCTLSPKAPLFGTTAGHLRFIGNISKTEVLTSACNHGTSYVDFSDLLQRPENGSVGKCLQSWNVICQFFRLAVAPPKRKC